MRVVVQPESLTIVRLPKFSESEPDLWQASVKAVVRGSIKLSFVETVPVFDAEVAVVATLMASGDSYEAALVRLSHQVEQVARLG